MILFATRLSLLALAAALLSPLPLTAQTFGAAERAAIQALIGEQIAAFQRDDGTAAYAMAAPGIKEIYPTAEAFMDMVEHVYSPVYRPRSLAFGTLAEGPLGPQQKVFVTGPDGLGYVATYSLEMQGDGSWRISGCVLARDSSPAI